MGLGALAATMGVGFSMGMVVPAFMRSLQYDMNLLIPNLIYDPITIMSLRARGKVDLESYHRLMKMSGFNEMRSDKMWDVTENLLSIMELISLHRRGELPESELYERGLVLRWEEEKLTELLKVTQVIPGSTDIIAFAVREVYTPEIAEAFGQFEGLDAVYDRAKTDITAIGMTKDTFAKYWAAHWMLPAVGQGFEMLHRRVIGFEPTPEQPLSLNSLMTALDIMPAWREPLTKISYSPYTRVDVRRMHKLGIIKPEGLIDAYMDLGYDEEKAKGMSDFTIRYNAEPIEDEQTEKDKEVIKERDLTKSDILTGYRDNLLTDAETRTALLALGYDANEVEYYVARVAYNHEKDETDLYLRYYGDAYVKGVLNHDQIVDKLGALNLPGKRIEYLFSVWDIERMSRVNKPTKAELMTFVRKKIIDRDTFIEEMKGLNYSERYIEWYQRTI